MRVKIPVLLITQRFRWFIRLMTNEDHAVSMRRAAIHCLSQSTKHVRGHGEVGVEANDMARLRDKALESFWSDSVPLGAIPVVGLDDEMSPMEFRKMFHCGNIPCLVRGLREVDFKRVTDMWLDDKGQINRDWFRRRVGCDTEVPVRQQQQETRDALDEQGRAAECNTIRIRMQDWLDSSASDPQLYLKDWHLQMFLSNQHPSVSSSSSSPSSLYTVPEIFRHDLLNTFLSRFTDGDYRFVYWGPAGSRTAIHSDVLHSFSWSYNVCGEKRWTFYVPPTTQEKTKEADSARTITVHQRAGETVFVPCGWMHEVENVVETLSINHNWITTANLDQTLECVLTEMVSVNRECQEWGIEGWDGRESMLRGCVGLDVTNLFLLLLYGLLDEEMNSPCNANVLDRAVLKHSICRLLCDENVALLPRLSAVLDDKDLAKKCIKLAQDATVELSA